LQFFTDICIEIAEKMTKNGVPRPKKEKTSARKSATGNKNAGNESMTPVKKKERKIATHQEKGRHLFPL
jgi:hypothetical protein